MTRMFEFLQSRKEEMPGIMPNGEYLARIMKENADYVKTVVTEWGNEIGKHIMHIGAAVYDDLNDCRKNVMLALEEWGRNSKIIPNNVKEWLWGEEVEETFEDYFKTFVGNVMRTIEEFSKDEAKKTMVMFLCIMIPYVIFIIALIADTCRACAATAGDVNHQDAVEIIDEDDEEIHGEKNEDK